MAPNSDPTNDPITCAATIGADHGRRAAPGFADGNTNRQHYERIARGLAEGDPEVYDYLPSAPLSGEWAGCYGISDLAEDTGVSEESDVFAEVCDTYEAAWSNAMVCEVERICAYHLYEATDPRNTGTRRSAPKMSRAHFQLIADVCLDLGLDARQVGAFADALASTNGRFDRARFERAAMEGGQ